MTVRRRLWLVAALLVGCSGEMAEQAKYEPYEAAVLFPNGRVNQHPLPGTVARDEPDSDAARHRLALESALLVRGQERYDIYCSPCHGRTGGGNGMVAQTYVPPPPSLHSERLRAVPDEYLFGVITEGFGRMYAYAACVSPRDRWAIVAYLRAIQLSQHAEVDALPLALRERLEQCAHDAPAAICVL
jgi:mono/diheme cytochrome c family protein